MNITAKYLTKVFPGGVYALDGFSAEIKHGSVVAVLGESGCGKTTLLRILSGLEKPTAGELYFDGVLFKDVPIKQRDTAVVFQEYILYPKMTVWENVATALGRYELPREEEERRVHEVLTELELIKFKNQLPRYLSGGQQQRVALARAIVRDPSLLLFDEPLSNLAEEQRNDYIKLILKVKQRLPRTTFVYVTHNPREAMAIGDHLLIMSEGKCIQFGEKERVWKYPYSADVLRTISTDIREVSGDFENGVLTDVAGEIYPFKGVDYKGPATLIYNPYDGYSPCLFDEKGNALTGEHEICYFDGEFDGKTLTFCGAEYSADEDFAMRFFGGLGKVKVGIKSIHIGFKPRYGTIKIKATRIGNGNVFDICGARAELFGADAFDGYLYIDPADIELYDKNHVRTLAHYRVYKESCAARAGGGKIKLACGTLDRDGVSGSVNVSFNRRAVITPVKKGGIRVTCLDEEDLGGEKLVYCLLKDFRRYVVFYAHPSDRFLGVRKLRVNVDPKGIDLR